MIPFGLLYLMLLAGCAAVPSTRPGTAAEDGRLASLAAAAERVESVPVTFKGTGAVRFARDGRWHRLRIAWAGMAPGKLRLEVLGLPGFSAATISMDGKNLYVRTRTPPRTTRHSISAVDLSDVFGVKIRPEDLFRLLGGGLPVRSGPFVGLETPLEADSAGTVALVTRRRLGTVARRIVFASESGGIEAVEVCDLFGRPAYRVSFEAPRLPGRGGTARSLTVTAPDSGRFRLEVERFWPEAEVDESIFVLEPRSS